MAEQLTGVIERVTFHNMDNGYCVLRIQARGVRDVVTVVGHLSQVIAGESIEATGDWVVDRNHGQQFKAESIRTVPPHTLSGIEKYLASGLVKGIGPTYAKKIVEAFGEKTLDIIDKSPTFLSQIKGIGAKRIERIRDGWHEQKHVRNIMVFLQSYGIGTARAVRIYKTYGDSAIEQVRANPYKLSNDIWGIGFRTADELAMQIGIPHDSPLRARAAVQYIVREASSHGHVCLPLEVVVEQTSQLTVIEPDAVQRAVDELRQTEELILDDGDAEMLYAKYLHTAEVNVATLVKNLGEGNHPLPSIDCEAAIKWTEERMQLKFAQAQRDAVWAALQNKFLILTGGPGTGKTTIVRAIIELFTAKQQRVVLCAPTGRAAKRLSESTQHDAKTIHRFLEFDAAIGTFRKTADNPLDVDLLVVDESSMADIVLMHKLLSAVPPWACVLLVGDVDQLPSVGPGSVLKDLIESNRVPVVRLTQVHRQAEASWIIRAAHAMQDGLLPESAPPGGEGDFYFIEADDENMVLDRIITMVKERIPARFGLNPIDDVQVLAPMNKGVMGVQNLNKLLQEALNPGQSNVKELQRLGAAIRIGDKVIQLKNNYTRDVYNGDIGRVTALDSIEQILTVVFDGRRVEYEFSDVDELALAYCCSIHKSQGSEYPAVVIPVHTQHFIMLQRNLIYTGITRGKRLVVLVGSKKALGIAVRNADNARRHSQLVWRMKQ